jgi:hypothetical protein
MIFFAAHPVALPPMANVHKINPSCRGPTFHFSRKRLNMLLQQGFKVAKVSKNSVHPPLFYTLIALFWQIFTIP